MLRAIRVSRDASAREGRACFLPAGEGAAATLEAAIDAVQPRCILALGRVPAAALLGVDEPLGKLRERLHRRGGIPVVVTFALPYLLRHAADKPRAWADLCRAVAAIA
jgi:DNA polymerase